jgi:hypothetical protein
VSPIDGRHLRLQFADLIFTEGSAEQSRRLQEGALSRKRGAMDWGGDRGVRGTVRSGVRRVNTLRTNPSGPPKRIGRRETPGPPVSWSWVQAH